MQVLTLDDGALKTRPRKKKLSLSLSKHFTNISYLILYVTAVQYTCILISKMKNDNILSTN